MYLVSSVGRRSPVPSTKCFVPEETYIKLQEPLILGLYDEYIILLNCIMVMYSLLDL